MRIWQVHTRYRQAGGEDTAVDNERRLLESGGHEVGTHFAQNPASKTGSVTALAKAPWNAVEASAAAAGAVEFGAEVAHVHNTWFAASPAVFPKLKASGLAVVATMHNYRLACLNAMLYRDGAPCQDCVGRVPWRGVVRGCYRDSAFQSAAVATTLTVHRRRDTWSEDVDVVIALTSFAADILVRSGVPATSIEVKPNVVGDPGPRSNPPSGSGRMLFVGRLAEEKGITDLVDAWLSVEGGDLELEVIGDGPLRASLPDTAGVHLSGSLPPAEVSSAMRGGRALVLPSRWYEGLPMVLVEALSCGLPVIVPNLGALPEIVGDAGLVFDVADPKGLANALNSLQDAALVDELGAAARAEFDQRYSEEAGLARLEEIYRLAVERAS